MIIVIYQDKDSVAIRPSGAPLTLSSVRSVVNQVAGWSALALGGLLVQDKFHGLDLGRWTVAVAILLVAAGITFLLTWPWLLRYLARVLLAEMKTLEPEAFEQRAIAVPAAAIEGPMTEWEAVNARRTDRVARANIQLLTDEIAAIQRLIRIAS